MDDRPPIGFLVDRQTLPHYAERFFPPPPRPFSSTSLLQLHLISFLDSLSFGTVFFDLGLGPGALVSFLHPPSSPKNFSRLVSLSKIKCRSRRNGIHPVIFIPAGRPLRTGGRRCYGQQSHGSGAFDIDQSIKCLTLFVEGMSSPAFRFFLPCSLDLVHSSWRASGQTSTSFLRCLFPVVRCPPSPSIRFHAFPSPLSR